MYKIKCSTIQLPDVKIYPQVTKKSLIQDYFLSIQLIESFEKHLKTSQALIPSHLTPEIVFSNYKMHGIAASSWRNILLDVEPQGA